MDGFSISKSLGSGKLVLFVSVDTKAPRDLLSELGDGLPALEDLVLWAPFTIILGPMWSVSPWSEFM